MKSISIRPNGSKRVATVNNLPSKTDQSQKKQCDVNEIIAKYKRTGQITHLAKNQGKYADLSEIPSLVDALNIVNQAAVAFETLPAKTRKYFGNDPVALVEFLKNPENRDEAILLGLIEKPKKQNNSESLAESPAAPSQQSSSSSP